MINWRQTGIGIDFEKWKCAVVHWIWKIIENKNDNFYLTTTFVKNKKHLFLRNKELKHAKVWTLKERHRSWDDNSEAPLIGGSIFVSVLNTNNIKSFQIQMTKVED